MNQSKGQKMLGSHTKLYNFELKLVRGNLQLVKSGMFQRYVVSLKDQCIVSRPMNTV